MSEDDMRALKTDVILWVQKNVHEERFFQIMMIGEDAPVSCLSESETFEEALRTIQHFLEGSSPYFRDKQEQEKVVVNIDHIQF